MTYISILPKNENSQSRMIDNCEAVMDLLFLAAKDVLQVPDTDIIAELNSFTTVSFNRVAVHSGAAPDVVIKISTSDHHLQPRFQTLCDRVVDGWNSHFGDIKLEVWVSLIDAWGTNADL
ncbi:hypothetical protein [Paenarthrobacter ilicis]|uniref:hypothetical protein n=1 Tax=Paenarthrobacter ilicis TaxID=43665 RepID=UPI0028D0879D|nr:hypothetical protein [Paenarthrobacter ilicis]